MLYVLDTDVVSNLRKQAPNPSLLTWLQATPEEDVGIPLVVVFEIQKGIETLRLEAKGDKANVIENWLEGLLRSRGDFLIPPDTAIARLQAKMFVWPPLQNFLRPQGQSSKPKFGGDLIVAATAIILGGAVVSFNVSDYEQIHKHFVLPGLYHPGTAEWIIKPKI